MIGQQNVTGAIEEGQGIQEGELSGEMGFFNPRHFQKLNQMKSSSPPALLEAQSPQRVTSNVRDQP
jgi:hypothetical protein